MKTLLFSRALALTGLALTPAAWLISGCGGGGGGSSNGGTTQPTSTATTTPTSRSTALPSSTSSPTTPGAPTSTPVPGATPTFTPLPTPRVPPNGTRILANIDLGRGQIGVLNLVISRGGTITGLIIVPPITQANSNFLLLPGTYALNGAFSLPNNFRFSGVLRTVTNAPLPLVAVGTTSPNAITVTVGSTVFPTQSF